MRRLLVNDALTQIPGTRTFWNDLEDWFGMEFVGGDYATLAEKADEECDPDEYDGEMISLIIRNATWFPPIPRSKRIPTISLLQDIFAEGPQREMQEMVINSSLAVAFNSEFTKSHYTKDWTDALKEQARAPIIPLPVNFSIFEPQNPMGCQQALGLPDGCVCWIGACREAGHIKGFDIFLAIVRANPDIPFVGMFKDQQPDYAPPNLRMFTRLTHQDLVKVIGACRVGLCTSRMESQHLAGIEMGACGLPLVVPSVGTYWKREHLVGAIVEDPSPDRLSLALRTVIGNGLPADADFIHSYWRKEFDREVIKAQWTKLIEEVENASASPM